MSYGIKPGTAPLLLSYHKCLTSFHWSLVGVDSEMRGNMWYKGKAIPGLLTTVHVNECSPAFLWWQGFDLRLEHTHCFSHHGDGGHYHQDTSPDSVHYLGYLLPAELLFRIDRPQETHLVGRDWSREVLVTASRFDLSEIQMPVFVTLLIMHIYQSRE